MALVAGAHHGEVLLSQPHTACAASCHCPAASSPRFSNAACVQGNFTLFGALTTAVDLQIQQFNSEFTLQFGEDKAHPALGKSVRDTVVSSLKTAKSAAIDGINYRCGTTAVTTCYPIMQAGNT